MKRIPISRLQQHQKTCTSKKYHKCRTLHTKGTQHHCRFKRCGPCGKVVLKNVPHRCDPKPARPKKSRNHFSTHCRKNKRLHGGDCRPGLHRQHGLESEDRFPKCKVAFFVNEKNPTAADISSLQFRSEFLIVACMLDATSIGASANMP